MSGEYKVTLLQLKANALGLAAADDKIELGYLSAEEVYRLAENLLLLNAVTPLTDEPGIIVRRGEKGWRISMCGGHLCLYHSTSRLDDFWAVEKVKELASLPPFCAPTPVTPRRAPQLVGTTTTPWSSIRSVAEVAGLFALGLTLIALGFWYGLPHKKLSDAPADVVVVKSSQEIDAIFKAVAGSYATGKKPGDSIVTISPQGRVTIGAIGKDGKASKPRLEAQAQAARRGSLAAVLVPAVGVIAELPPDAVNVGAGNSRWRKVLN
jgi:hypothetical protein